MPVPSPERLSTLLQQFVNAPSWAESRRIVEEHPEILTPEADALFGRVLEAYQDDPRAVEALTEYRGLLRRCREESIEVAFADCESADSGTPLQALVEARSPAEVLKVVEAHPSLLSDEVNLMICLLIENARRVGDEEMACHLDERYQTLRRIREQGTDTEQLTGVNKPLIQTIFRFMNANTWTDSLRVVQDHPTLLSDEADDLMGQLLKQVRAQGDDNSTRILVEHRDLLRRCRETTARVAFAEKMGLPPGLDPLEDVRAILEELSRPACRTEMPQRIQLCEQTLSRVGRETHPMLWAAFQAILADSLSQNPIGKRAENTERAIHHYGRALQVCTREALPAEWAGTQNNLGEAYRNRIRGEWAENIEHAIHHFSLALEVYTREAFPIDWAGTQNNLAAAYAERIRGEPAENIERAIHHFSLALEVYTREAFPAEWAAIQNNLGEAHRNRIRSERADNIERAIHHYERALNAYTRQAFPAEWAGTQNNLANAYCKRIRGERADNIERAIHHYSLALEVYTREAFPAEWAGTQNNMAPAYADRIRGERAENIERAIHHFCLALEVYTREAFPADWAMIKNNLGNAYYKRVRGKRAENIERATHHYEQALEEYTIDVWPERARDVRRRLGAAHFAARDWAAAHQAFAIAQDLTERFYAAALLREVQEQEIGANARMVAQDALCLVQMGHPEEAWRTLERGRARALRQGLDRAQARRALATVAPEIREHYETLSAREQVLRARLRLPEKDPHHRPYPEVRDELASVTEELHDLENDLLEAVGVETDIPTVGELQALPLLQDRHTALVSLALTDHGALAFLLTGEGLQHQIIERLSRDDVRVSVQGSDDEQWSGWLGAYFRQLAAALARHSAAWEPARDHWRTTMTETLDTLGQQLWPMLDGMLQQANIERVVLLPQGMLFVLPLHACPLDGDERVCDRYTLAYAPAGAVLARLASEEETVSDHLQSLLVANPTGDLPHIPSEILAIQETLADARTLWEREATEASVAQSTRDAEVIHFSGHGTYNWRDPELSGLLLRDPNAEHVNPCTGEGADFLTVAEMRDVLRLSRTRLVTLSACETGLTEIRRGLADEYIGLPGVLLQAGARAVVASLWAVDDLATALLMCQFYQEWNQGAVPIAEALQRAQKWLRTRTREQVKDALGELDALWKPWAAQTDDRAMQRRAREQYWEIRQARRRLNRMEDLPFAHPYWWAGFQAVGDVL
jgi:CHAT domain-containing protein